MSSVKMLHIADVHIGMKFSGYPEATRQKLIEARFQSLENAVTFADQNHIDWILVSGDLFENLKVSKKDIERTIAILDAFNGDRVFILPGNHDYYDDTIALWKAIEGFKSDKIQVLTQCQSHLETINDMTICLHAAPCFSKHSATHQLDWLQKEPRQANVFNMLIAHGSIKELSPDIKGEYFPMSLELLNRLDMDLMLLGHTHVPYPLQEATVDHRIFNAGTPEPDGLNYSYEGGGWFITIHPDKKITASRVALGSYRFMDVKVSVNEGLDVSAILNALPKVPLSKTLARLTLQGYLDEDVYDKRYHYLDALESHFMYVEMEDSGLKPKFSQDMINKAFSYGSLPYTFFKRLIEETDEDTAHLAYDIMQEVIRRD